MSVFFAQQHIFTQFGHTVPIENTPHFQFLKGDTRAYSNYLIRSWEYYAPNHTPLEIEKRIDMYNALDESVVLNGVREPVVTFVRPNGDTMIFDGNHRAAICAFYGMELPKKYIPLIDAIERLTALSKERYGAPKGIPYQSIYAPDGTMILKGRRTDLKTRFDMLDPNDLTDQDVIAVGCNYGNDLMLTHGAKSLTGTDIDLGLLTAAVRLAVIFQKQVQYKVWDMNAIPKHMGQYDTAFVFSVDAHLKTLAGLAHFVKNHVKNTVYYETHVGHAFPEKIKNIFSKVWFVGKVGDRHLYRCVKS